MNKKKKLTRSQAEELYKDLKQTMGTIKQTGGDMPKKKGTDAVAKEIADAIKQGMKKDEQNGVFNQEESFSEASPTQYSVPQNTGIFAAVFFVTAFAFLKFGVTVLETTGILKVEVANASYDMPIARPLFKGGQYSKEEALILKNLDARRTQLEERNTKLDARAADLDAKDREFAAKLTEIRDLTQKLKSTRQKSKQKRSSQLEQLANVYGSMNPKEAATLIEQLDVTIALGLIERMPEKRIGQILALMSPERALTITRMLSQ